MYKSSDFNKCLFNPCKDDLFLSYSQLRKLKSVDEKLIKYIICVYDYNSPIVKQHRDLELRKQEAASFSGYDLAKDNHYLKSVFDLKDPVAINAIDMFIKDFIYNRLWARITCDENLYWEIFRKMMKPIEEGEKDKEKDNIAALNNKAGLGKTMDEIESRLDVAYRKLYGDEDSSKFTLKRALPEDMAVGV